MIKIIKKIKNSVAKLKDAEKGIAVISRAGDKICLLNLETDARISFDKASGEVTLSFNLQDGEIIMVGEKNGFAEKKEIIDRR